MSLSLKRIDPPASLMEVTVDRIRDAIIAGDLPLGCKLSEQRLADKLGISRSPVRDALA
ncbi:MAG: GntR family transcriptional regulator, partial [Oricola sp.]|nr:GntR family transcriptional regulator [Oricola sp.]